MIIATVARSNADVNEKHEEKYWNYEKHVIDLGDIEKYQIYQRIGKGKYSEVFEGRKDKEKVIIKALKPVKIPKISREILVLKHLSHDNIIKLIDVVADQESQVHSLVFEYIENEDYAKIFESLGYRDIVNYSKQILCALEYCHSMGIIHRDIKPQNMVINHAKKQLKIIDWGLAEFYHPKKEYSVRVASRYYKGPELLVDYPYYDYSLDIWSFGCVLAEMIFKKRPFFHGESNNDQLMKIIRVLGYCDLKTYMDKYQICSPNIRFAAMEQRVALASFIPFGEESVYEDAVNLLENILIYDHHRRFTAKECLGHSLFKSKC
ncbi:protein kinase domain-containing protein [Ordospora colligata]|nr:protein kinase domain-containing protein [Ordospora colligata]